MQGVWWISHIWIILIQIIAFVPYLIGSRRFYTKKSDAMWYIGIGIFLDIVIAITASSGILPRMSERNEVPWGSILFISHITTAGIGMFGFIALFIYVLYRGYNKPYPRLRNFQYKILLRLWCFGVLIALANFIGKAIFHIRIYDFI